MADTQSTSIAMAPAGVPEPDGGADWRPRSAVLLVNLGSPRAPTRAVGAFLAEFLSDPRVVELPPLLWRPLLRGVVIPLRARRVARAYAGIWDTDSPLRRISQAQCSALQRLLREVLGDAAPRVRLAMCYQGPSIAQVVGELLGQGVECLTVLPLYPQYSAATTAAVSDRLGACLARERRVPHLAFVRDYHEHPAYIGALAASVREHWQLHGQARHLLMSFHGIPVANVRRGDPYASQCERTAQRLATVLGLAPADWSLGYQSRFGGAKWLEPYTDAVLERLALEAAGSVDVICPSFAADCLETLDEIALTGRERFHSAGGGEFRVVACLNQRDDHVRMMSEIVRASC